MSPSDAKAEILRCAGTQFDSVLANIFVKLDLPAISSLDTTIADNTD